MAAALTSDEFEPFCLEMPISLSSSSPNFLRIRLVRVLPYEISQDSKMSSLVCLFRNRSREPLLSWGGPKTSRRGSRSEKYENSDFKKQTIFRIYENCGLRADQCFQEPPTSPTNVLVCALELREKKLRILSFRKKLCSFFKIVIFNIFVWMTNL